MKTAICTSAYPLPDAFVNDYIDGVIDATADNGTVMLVMAAESEFETAQIRDRLPGNLTVLIDRDGPVMNPPALRRRMLETAMSTDADVFIFCDFDDRILGNAVPEHLQALAGFDMSFGDLIPVDCAGRDLGYTFFEDANVPTEVESVGALLDRNFMGFSNTAVKRSAVTRKALAIPDGVPAADWWFFSMLLLSGSRAKQTSKSVVYYRNYAESLLGSKAAGSLGALRKRAEIVEAHYKNLPECAAIGDRCAKVRRLIDSIDEGAQSAVEILAQITQSRGVWLDDVRLSVVLNETTFKSG